MKNKDSWKPSKYIFKKGKLVTSNNIDEVSVASRLVTNLVAAKYQKHLPMHATGKLLDLGCGKVPLFEAYRSLVSENICIDWENTLHKNTYLDHEINITKELPFHAAEFDTIILSDVLEHIPEPQKLWDQMERLLAPGGKIILNVPFMYWLHEQPNDFYRYTEYALRRFANQSNLNLVHLSAIGGLLEVLTDIFAKLIVRIPLIGSAIASFLQGVSLRFMQTKIGYRLLTKSSKLFPLGYFLIAEKPLNPASDIELT